MTTTLAEQMAASAKEAMKLTRKYFVVELDYTPESLTNLDDVIDDYRFAMPNGETPDAVALLVRTWGAYVGEVVRKKLGGRWNEYGEASDESVTMTVGGRSIHPLAHVRRRIESGIEYNLFSYFESLPKQE